MAYWIGEFIRTILAYGLVMFLWPSVVFRSHLAKHSRTYRFAFCALLMVLLPDMAVLCLGLIPHALNAWVVRILFYGIFLYWFAPLTANFRASSLKELEKLSRGTIGGRSFRHRAARLPERALKSIGRGICSLTKDHVPECITLAALCVYSVLYFSWGAFELRSFSFSDGYVHQAWITGLTEEKIFSGGIYPEGMHTFIYLMHVVSGVSVYNLLLFTGAVHTAVLMISIWIFLREIFHWDGTPLLVVLLFLTLDQQNMSDVFLMARLQGPLPQEFAMYAAFLGGAFLIRYLKEQKNAAKQNGRTIDKEPDCDEAFLRKAWHRISRILYDGDPNLRMFTWSVAVTFAVHFYVTIMMVFLCLAIALPMIRQMLNRKGLPMVLKAAVLAVLITMLPMAGAFAEGHPLQGSLNWAMNVMQESSSGGNGADSQQSETSQNVTENIGIPSSGSAYTGKDAEGDETAENEAAGAAQESAAEKIYTELQRAGQILQRLEKALQTAVKTYYERGFQVLYSGRIGRIYCAAVLLALVLPILMRILYSLVQPWRRFRAFADLYMIPALAAMFFLTDFLASSLGLVQLIEATRVLSMTKIFLLASGGMLPDMLSCCLQRVFRQAGEQNGRRAADGVLLLTGISGCLFLVIGSGHYHGYLYYEVSRYPEAVEVTESIIRDMPRNSYTIVSPTEELYQVVRQGYHEELLTLIKTEEIYPGYTIPTRYLFVYLEKNPLWYCHCHFFTGPGWLALSNKNYQMAQAGGIVSSQSPDYISSPVSEDDADKTLNYDIGSSAAAMDPEGRAIIEAKTARWIKNFQKAYPNACRVYYEDERFVCYQITQDPQIPYKLGFTAQQDQAWQNGGNQ